MFTTHLGMRCCLPPMYGDFWERLYSFSHMIQAAAGDFLKVPRPDTSWHLELGWSRGQIRYSAVQRFGDHELMWRLEMTKPDLLRVNIAIDQPW